MRRAITLLLLAATLFLSPAAALAAYSYESGEQVALGFSRLPSGYTVYWTSDRDGFLMQGSTLRTSSLSVGLHEISYFIYRTSTRALVYSGSVEVEVKAPAATTPPSSGSATTGAYAPGEFEPVSELLLGTEDAYSVEDMYPELLDALRGVVRTTIYVDSAYVRYDLEDIFAATGVDDADYEYVTAPVDSIWMRDYGPLFVKDARGDLEVVDLSYYPERPNDDAIPARVARERGLASKRLRLYWEGGNYTSDGKGNVFASDVLHSRNSGSASQIDASVGAAFSGRLNVLDHMRDDGGTGHIDMFVLMTGPRSLLLNRFPSGHQNKARMDRHAQALESMGYSVTRLDLGDRRFSSYTNGLIVNDVALVPTYGKASTDGAALAAYRAAGYRTVGIDCRRIIQWSGAIHCITMTVPR
jgi:agmatine deiminase